ncbi:HAD hydrolase family protein [Nocardia sp. NPDC052566]|uniref:HAD hydrolase family protein n=1 Tax=Nocardia sp. NPDC052566 TaxID=3364330 RepID=UPI0037CA4FE8
MNNEISAAPVITFAAFDLDGTLLDADGRLPSAVDDSLIGLRAGGITPLLVTGRTVRSMLELDPDHTVLSGLANQLLLADGCVVLDRSTHTVTNLLEVPRQAVALLLRAGVDEFVVDTGTDLRASSRRAALSYARAYALPRDAIDIGLESFWPVTGITVFDQPAKVAEALAGVPHDTDAIGPFDALLIKPRGACKATGLAAYLARCRPTIDLDSVIAFGDAYNDGCLLGSSALGVAVRGADETACRCADIRLRQPLAAFLADLTPVGIAALRLRFRRNDIARGRPCFGGHRRP